MLAKLTSKNQITLPKQAIEAMGEVSHFRVEIDGDRLVLTPARLGAGDAVRKKLEDLGITQQDIADAIAWARKQPKS
jgi:bifunctional DNA-binding transcriptional regulator/antitoxin component of YhaV-PrlF toxin-antitoxin module